MATKYWLGTAAAVAQVDTFTPANVEEDDVFTLTATAEDGTTTVAISFTATTNNVANVCTGLSAAWNASTNPLCTAVTAADGVTELTLTADVAGVPFYVASSTTEGGGNDTQTLTRAATTASSGPNDWGVAANWSASGVPEAADNVYFENSTVSVSYGLYAQAAVALASLHVSQTYSGFIGTANYYMQILSSILNIGHYYGSGSPTGSGRIKFNLAATACVITIYNSKTSAEETYKQPIRLLCNQANTTITIIKGKVAIAADKPGETSTLGTAYLRYDTTVATDSSLELGSGVTITTVSKSGGDLTLRSACTTLTSTGGTCRVDGSGAITTLNCDGGAISHKGSGTISTLNLDGGTFNWLGSATISNCVLSNGFLNASATNIAKTLTDGGFGATLGTVTISINTDAVTLTDGLALNLPMQIVAA